jgi:predicted outer membrane protein
MKKIQLKSFCIATTTALLFTATTASAQQSKDTVKAGKTNDRMVIDPQQPKDGITANIAKPAEGMAVLTDTGFISKNIKDNIVEIQLSKVGMDRGTGKQVKNLAAQMAADHTMILNALRKLAVTKQAPTPPMQEMPTAPEILIEKGKDFNAGWASQMLTMHAEKIAELEGFLPVTQSAELKAIIGAALPKIRSHRDMLLKIPGAKVTKVPNIAVQ